MPTKATPKKNKSALKRVRQTEKRALRNRAIKNKLKTLSKKVAIEVANKNVEGAKAALNETASVISKAAAKGIIHKNTASRKVSLLTRLVNSLLLPEAT